MSCARHERSGLTERRGGRGGPNQQSVCLSSLDPGRASFTQLPRKASVECRPFAD